MLGWIEELTLIDELNKILEEKQKNMFETKATKANQLEDRKYRDYSKKERDEVGVVSFSYKDCISGFVLSKKDRMI